MALHNQDSIEDFSNQPITQSSEVEKVSLDQLAKVEVLGTELLKSISHVKRFVQRLQGDQSFRERLSVDPYKTVADYNLKVDPEEIRPLWDEQLSLEEIEESSSSVLLKHCNDLKASFRLNSLFQRLFASFKDPRIDAWRKRQIARGESQFNQSVHNSIYHLPLAFELSKGCSIGCHFCGISAPRLGDIFLYNSENAKLWNEVLQTMKEILGFAAGAGFCYWATDPFDNPDYEKFCSDYHKILGVFPQTTTAQPLKDVKRTKALIKSSIEKGCLNNRFSILSLKMLNQIHEQFSPEELLLVNFVLQNKESIGIKAHAGRSRDQNLKKGQEDSELPAQGTIACVSGFLFNMVDRSVKLISPCNANERWPLGYMVFDEGTFTNANDLKLLIERMIDEHMPTTVRPTDIVNFRPNLKYEGLDNGFKLSSRVKTFKFRLEPFFRDLGDTIHQGGKTAAEIAAIFEARGVKTAYTYHYLNLMFNKGVLDDEPKPKNVELRVPHYPPVSLQDEANLAQSEKAIALK